MSKTK